MLEEAKQEKIISHAECDEQRVQVHCKYEDVGCMAN